MKKSILSIIILLATVLSFQSVKAQNLVVKQDPYAVDLGLNLSLCVDFAGLGNINSVDIIVHYTAEVETNCYNKGQDKGPVPGLTRNYPDQAATLKFDVRNGRTRGCQTLYTNFVAGDCPSTNMRGVVADVKFTNIWFEILGQTFNLSDPASVK